VQGHQFEFRRTADASETVVGSGAPLEPGTASGSGTGQGVVVIFSTRTRGLPDRDPTRESQVFIVVLRDRLGCGGGRGYRWLSR
jgi:hypothetical protein